MNEFGLHDFLIITKELVSMMKSENECERLNSFIVGDNKFNFQTDYHSAKGKNPYYFSRDEKRLVFPTLMISISGDSLGEYKNGMYGEYCHPIEIGIIDEKKELCTNCPPCDKRNKEEVYIDMGNVLRKTINTISNYKLYEVTKDAVTSMVYGQSDVMGLKLANGIYDTIKVIVKETNAYNIQFKHANENLSFTEHEFNQMNLLGKFTSLVICDICAENELLFSYKTYSHCC